MKEVTVYVSDDGKKFETLDECLNHEKILHDMVSKALALQEYCKCKDGCANCVFADDDACSIKGSPWSWNIQKFQDALSHIGSPEYDD